MAGTFTAVYHGEGLYLGKDVERRRAQALRALTGERATEAMPVQENIFGSQRLCKGLLGRLSPHENSPVTLWSSTVGSEGDNMTGDVYIMLVTLPTPAVICFHSCCSLPLDTPVTFANILVVWSLLPTVSVVCVLPMTRGQLSQQSCEVRQWRINMGLVSDVIGRDLALRIGLSAQMR